MQLRKFSSSHLLYFKNSPCEIQYFRKKEKWVVQNLKEERGKIKEKKNMEYTKTLMTILL